MTEAEKLKTLLEHWIEHNAAHQDEFGKWAERARGAGLENVSLQISAAAQRISESNECLRKALSQISP